MRGIGAADPAGHVIALVAAEVRRLAEGTSSAAPEVKLIVGEALGKIGIGSSLVTRSSKTLREILEAIPRLDTTVASVSLASQEQSVGLEEATEPSRSSSAPPRTWRARAPGWPKPSRP